MSFSFINNIFKTSFNPWQKCSGHRKRYYGFLETERYHCKKARARHRKRSTDNASINNLPHRKPLQNMHSKLKTLLESSLLLKPCTHDQICIRMQILYICKICIRTQIWPCVRIYSRMQNLHVCKSWKICTCLRPSANLILRIRKICVYANLVM